MRRNSPPHPRDRGPVVPEPTVQSGVQTSAGIEDDPAAATDLGWVIETVVSPFHCLYQDALYFHTQSRLAQSEGEAARLARAALLLYVSSAEALVRQAAVELGRPELRGLLADPSRPLPLAEAWRLLPAIVAEPGVPTRTFVPEYAPWPQFAELLMLETSWVYPGPPSSRRAIIAQRTAIVTTNRSSPITCLPPYNTPFEPKPSLFRARACHETPTLCDLGTSTPRGVFLMPPSKPLTAGWAVLFAIPSAIALSQSE